MVYKRDGRSEVFKPEKIQNAVLKAFYEVDGKETKCAKEIAEYISTSISEIQKDLGVEEIQDLVEEKIAQFDMDVARKYIIYRNDRSRIREMKSPIRIKARNTLNSQNDDRQNANVDGKSFGGRVGAVNSEVMKQIALDEYMSEMSRTNHLNNRIYIHDLDSYAAGMHNCLSIPFDKLLANGFNTRQTDVRPAQSVNTAGQLIAVIFQLQSFTAMTKFKEKYGEIPNVSDKKFFTNSMHVPVWEEMSPFEKIDIESQLTGYSSAGCITYVELASSIKNNIDALEEIVNYAMDKDIPYFAVNVPNDMCTNCGYTDEIGEACPMCGCKKIRRLRRVTGYLTGDYTEAFNEGKQQEVDFRVKHFNNNLEEKVKRNEPH